MKKILFITFVLFYTFLEANTASLRVQPSILQSNTNSYIIIDTRAPSLYKKGHIDTAINFPVKLTYAHQQVNGKLTDPFSMQIIIQNLGLHIDDKIVIYDDGSFFDAARLFWALEVYGFNDVKLLNAGYNQWKELDYKTSTKTPILEKSDYITIIDNKRLATKFATQVATKNPNQIIIDARGNNAYIGEVSAAKRYGHIPKAINIPATHNINHNKELVELKGIDALQDLYKDIDKDKKVIIYCAIGKISATNYFAMRELGYNVSNYDASWKEWGNDFKLPIDNPSKNK